MNIRATWQALSNLSLITRYDFQYSTVDTTSNPNNGSLASTSPVGTIQSAYLTNHIISENASWTPLACLNLQAGGSYVLDNLNTPVAGSAGINNLVPNSMNNYWTVDASAGYEINEKTHLQLQYDYYRAADYVDNAAITTTAATTPGNAGMPYGADTESHNVTATLTHQFNKALEGSLKYGFSKYRDGTSGGQDNYEAHLVYASMKYGF